MVTGLDLEGLTCTLAGTRVLDGIDLTVPDGTSLALVGASGSGKTTILRIVAGLRRPDAGTVRIGGVDQAGVPAHRRGVGMVFQDRALFPHLDVGGNVAFGLRMLRWDRDRATARVGEVLEVVGLSGMAGRNTATLSGGEAQRVALARALAPAPRVLLLDEPLAALDQALRERLLVELRSIFTTVGVTVVTVTHDPTEAAALGDRIAVLHRGRVVQVDRPGAILADPRSAAVAELVGHRNLLGLVARGGRVETPWGVVRAPDAPDGPVTVLVPSDALTGAVPEPAAPGRGPAGTIHGTVRSLLYRGGTPFAVVGSATVPELEVRADPWWSVGDEVCLAVDAGRVRVLVPER